MAGEDVGEQSHASDDSLEGWLDAKAEELGVNREELLAQLRSNGDAPESAGGAGGELAALRREFRERLAATHDEFESELDDVRSDFDEKIQDVRERVVQVKREADEKAAVDHDHPDLRQHTDDLTDRTESVADRADDLAAELDDVAETVETLDEAVEQLDETVEQLDETVETGFENYEDVLEYLTDATDDLEAKLNTLAEATIGLQDRTETLAARNATRAAADELAHLANRRGVEEAKCSHCDETVHIGLLAEPKCPHCASTFSDVEPKQGFFGSHRLVVGDPPALEGERADWDVEAVTERESIDPAEALEDIVEDDDE